jgi:hypothetical protein
VAYRVVRIGSVEAAAARGYELVFVDQENALHAIVTLLSGGNREDVIILNAADVQQLIVMLAAHSKVYGWGTKQLITAVSQFANLVEGRFPVCRFSTFDFTHILTVGLGDSNRSSIDDLALKLKLRNDMGESFFDNEAEESSSRSEPVGAAVGGPSSKRGRVNEDEQVGSAKRSMAGDGATRVVDGTAAGIHLVSYSGSSSSSSSSKSSGSCSSGDDEADPRGEVRTVPSWMGTVEVSNRRSHWFLCGSNLQLVHMFGDGCLGVLWRLRRNCVVLATGESFRSGYHRHSFWDPRQGTR